MNTLTRENYFSKENQLKYCGTSQIKALKQAQFGVWRKRKG